MFDEECEFFESLKQFTIDDNTYRDNETDWCECHKCKCADKKDCYFKRLEEASERIEELVNQVDDLEDEINENEEEISNLNIEVEDLEYCINHSLNRETSNALVGYIIELDKDLNLYVREHNRTLEEVCYDLEQIIRNS